MADLTCLQTLRILRADNNEVESLDGLESLSALESLSLRHNQVTSVNLQKCGWPALQTLHLSHNRLTSVEHLDCVPQLRTLCLDHNNLASLNCAKQLPRLRILRVSFNSRLEVLDIHGLHRLQTLYADFCALSEIHGMGDALRLANLSLRAQSSEVFEWPRSLPSSIQRLFLSGNMLQNSFSKQSFLHSSGPVWSELIYLELAGCQLEKIPTALWAMMPNIRHLNLDYNLFRELPSLLKLRRLARLSCVSCRIVRTAGMARAVELLQLESLDTRNNPCTLGFYGHAATIGHFTSSKPGATKLPPGFASKTAPFPDPSVVQPAWSTRAALEHDALDTSTLQKSFFHKRLPATQGDPTETEVGAAQVQAFEAVDSRFVKTLPEEVRKQRILHRGVIAMSCPRLRYLDGILVEEVEVDEANQMLA